MSEDAEDSEPLDRMWRGRAGLVARGIAPFVAALLALYLVATEFGVSGALGVGDNGGDTPGLDPTPRTPRSNRDTGSLCSRGYRRSLSLGGRCGVRFLGHTPAGRRLYDGLRHRQDSTGPQAHLPLSTPCPPTERRRLGWTARSPCSLGGFRTFYGSAGRGAFTGGGRSRGSFCPARLAERGEAAHARAGFRGHARGDCGLPDGYIVNVLAVDLVTGAGGERITYFGWLALTWPIEVSAFLALWCGLVLLFPTQNETPLDRSTVSSDLEDLGPARPAEWRLAGILALTGGSSGCWSRSPAGTPSVPAFLAVSLLAISPVPGHLLGRGAGHLLGLGLYVRGEPLAGACPTGHRRSRVGRGTTLRSRYR